MKSSQVNEYLIKVFIRIDVERDQPADDGHLCLVTMQPSVEACSVDSNDHVKVWHVGPLYNMFQKRPYVPTTMSIEEAHGSAHYISKHVPTTVSVEEAHGSAHYIGKHLSVSRH